jgi:SAM-dependent methyltransferase
VSTVFSSLLPILSCPYCGSAIRETGPDLICTGSSCLRRFPAPGGVPILINEHTSTFRIRRYVEREPPSARARLRREVRKRVPRISANCVARQNYRRLRELLLERNEAPRVLVIGGAEPGEGLDELCRSREITLVETDVVIGSRTRIVCDASTLPFLPESFDAVVIQAVLEYVFDPVKSVSEIFRVLKRESLVYSEMPFLQPVHGGKHDFTRLTHLGHRRLFRQFAEISSGPCAGPGMVLAGSIQQLFLSLAGSELTRDLVRLGASFSLFWLKYLDRFLIHKRGALDGASGTFFLGSKSDAVLSDGELLKLYRGAVPAGGIV